MRKAFVLLVGFLAICTSREAKAQDAQFSQFYAAPLYINPAFTGASQFTRFGVNYRSQWPNLQASFETFSFYADHYIDRYNSGIGLIVTTDREGQEGLTSTNIGFSYAYQLQLTENLVFRPGVQYSLFSRNAAFQNLVFTNQINTITGEIDRTITDPAIIAGQDLQSNFGDISVGGVLYSRRLFLGVALQHITEPNQSLLDGDEFSVLPARLTIHGGYKIDLRSGGLRNDLTYTLKERSITPVFQYKEQGPFSQLDIGAFLHLEPINFGLQYRGLPYKQFEDFPNHESLIFSLGVTTNNFNIGYSFDYTLSKLTINAGGAHEFSLSYIIDFSKPQITPRSRWRIPCPKN
ncbi:PorP/SprF family type IX secretion system membrane protein [Roseivirga misakiensis]|uniref:Type IX secretion system membrane protein PorP/SprF n=1 Tax=Roseivirga misakiensis TaxID=1563681 RepID=A0A1E5SK41_9BACT|nr:type IX secretion system membrane protein PorP/SprF [Roseivirga misakiensis]OEJ99494.1 hypothetical protein BFP71_07885 [Roseivirga misakiensis]